MQKTSITLGAAAMLAILLVREPAASSAGQLQALPTLDASDQRSLADGHILTRCEDSQEAIKTVTSIGRIHHSAFDVFRLMTDFRNYPRIYSSIESVRVESETKDRIVARFRLAVQWPLAPRTVTTVTLLDPGRTAFSWHRKSGTLRQYDGQMVAQPIDATSCLAFYSARVDPGYDWLPDWFVTWGQTYVLPSIIRAIRDTLDRHDGPYWAAGVQRPQFDSTP
ncbi:MAG: SRPBCC family protein [Cyanobacteria bacterium REEB65]|nr:SRPBCC family protein [Cyanobacteria bacterium REEB65]